MSDKMAADYSVLIVDDVPTNVMLVQAILKKEGYTLLTADSGKKALEMTDAHNPNLILLDIMMPEMDGLQATQFIRSFDQDIPIVAMTANAFTEDKIKAKKAGMNAHLSKPLDRDRLIRVVAKLCKK